MTSLYILLGIILFFVIALYLSNRIQRRKGNVQERETLPPSIDARTKEEKESGCCGMHEVCEKDSLIAAFRESLNISTTKNSTGSDYGIRAAIQIVSGGVP